MQDATSTVTTAAPAVARPPADQPAYQRFLRMWHSAPLDEPEPPPQRAAVPALQQGEEAADGGLGRARRRVCAAVLVRASRSVRHLAGTPASPRFV